MKGLNKEIKVFFVVVIISVVIAVTGIWLLQGVVRNQVTHTPPVVPAPSPQPQTVDTTDFILSEVEGWQTYRNEEFGFEVKYPEDRFSGITTEAREVGVLFYGPMTGLLATTNYVNGTYIPSLAVKYTQLDASAYQERTEEYTDHFGYAEVVFEPFTVNGSEAYRYQSGSFNMGVVCQSEEALIVLKEGSIVLQYARCTNTNEQSATEIMEEEKALFQQILSTFRFIEPIGRNSIRTIDFSSYFSSIPPFIDCATYLVPSYPPVYVDYIEYYDVTGDGSEEAIVIASSCYTGTAGPDIVAVYELDSLGEIKMLEFEGGLQTRYIRWNPTKNFLAGWSGRYCVESECDDSKWEVVEYQWDAGLQKLIVVSKKSVEAIHRNAAFWTDYCYIDESNC